MESPETARPRRVRSTWVAVAAAELLLLVGLALVFAGFAASFELCTISLGCDAESSSNGGALLLLVLGLVALAAAPAAASYLSGWPSPIAAAALSIGAFVAAFLVGTIVFADFLVGLVVALGVGGSVAVRPASPYALRVRVVVVAAVVAVAAFVGTGVRRSTGATLVLALLTLPAIGYADSLSRAFRKGSEGPS
jgi:hypothetical protein